MKLSAGAKQERNTDHRDDQDYKSRFSAQESTSNVGGEQKYSHARADDCPSRGVRPARSARAHLAGTPQDVEQHQRRQAAEYQAGKETDREMARAGAALLVEMMGTRLVHSDAALSAGVA